MCGRVGSALAFLVLVAALPGGCGSDSSSVAPARGSSGSAGGPVDGGGSGGAGGSAGTGWPGGSAGAPQGGAAGVGAQAGQGGTAGAQQGGTGGAAQGGTGGCPSAGWTFQCATACPSSFPQGVPDSDFIENACSYGDTDHAVDNAVNQVMASLTGCGIGSDCPITVVAGTTTNEICQNWFAAVTQALRAQGYCAGQHAVGSTDEIAVNSTCCEGKWYGYHICNYGGAKVVWNPGARRGWWAIKASYCGP
jgi:hypothetical protein